MLRCINDGLINFPIKTRTWAFTFIPQVAVYLVTLPFGMSSSFSPRVASPNLSRRHTGNQQVDHSPVTIGSPSLDRHSGRFSRPANLDESDKQNRRVSARESLLRRVSGRSSMTGGESLGAEERRHARPLEILTNTPKLPVPNSLTNEQMYSNFEEWMKMCTDNVRLPLANPFVTRIHQNWRLDICL